MVCILVISIDFHLKPTTIYMQTLLATEKHFAGFHRQIYFFCINMFSLEIWIGIQAIIFKKEENVDP